MAAKDMSGLAGPLLERHGLRLGPESPGGAVASGQTALSRQTDIWSKEYQLAAFIGTGIIVLWVSLGLPSNSFVFARLSRHDLLDRPCLDTQ